jgi:hypothetical protein
MCTVSVLQLPGNVIRVACNRDEQVTRAAALPPVVRRIGGVRAMMPVDPVSGGTWVGADEAGVVMALLNYNPRGAIAAAAAARSRGVIIPSLLGLGGAREVAGAAAALRPGLFGAFRLVVVDREACAEVADADRAGATDCGGVPGMAVGVLADVAVLSTGGGVGGGVVAAALRVYRIGSENRGSSAERRLGAAPGRGELLPGAAAGGDGGLSGSVISSCGSWFLERASACCGRRRGCALV